MYNLLTDIYYTSKLICTLKKHTPITGKGNEQYSELLPCYQDVLDVMFILTLSNSCFQEAEIYNFKFFVYHYSTRI